MNLLLLFHFLNLIIKLFGALERYLLPILITTQTSKATEHRSSWKNAENIPKTWSWTDSKMIFLKWEIISGGSGHLEGHAELSGGHFHQPNLSCGTHYLHLPPASE